MTSSPDATAPDPEQVRAYNRAVLDFSAALIASWIMQLLPLPWSLAAGVFAVLGMVLLVRVIRVARATRRGPSVLGLAIGGFLVCGIVVAISAFSLLLYGPLSAQAECVDGALTEQGRQACASALPDQVSDWLSDLLGG